MKLAFGCLVGIVVFYMADDRLMAVPIRFGSNGKTVELGAPLALFATLGRAACANTNGQPHWFLRTASRS